LNASEVKRLEGEYKYARGLIRDSKLPSGQKKKRLQKLKERYGKLKKEATHA
jgi:hypothetical protein